MPCWPSAAARLAACLRAQVPRHAVWAAWQGSAPQGWIGSKAGGARRWAGLSLGGGRRRTVEPRGVVGLAQPGRAGEEPLLALWPRHLYSVQEPAHPGAVAGGGQLLHVHLWGGTRGGWGQVNSPVGDALCAERNRVACAAGLRRHAALRSGGITPAGTQHTHAAAGQHKGGPEAAACAPQVSSRQTAQGVHTGTQAARQRCSRQSRVPTRCSSPR